MNKLTAILCFTLAALPAIFIFAWDVPYAEPASIAVWVMLMSLLGGAWWMKE